MTSANAMLVNLHSDDAQRWLARIRLLAWPYLDNIGRAQFETSLSMQFSFPQDVKYAAEIRSILHRAIAQAEAFCGRQVAPTGAVIPPGELFKAFHEIGEVIKSANSALLIVDPYADDTALSKTAILAHDNVTIRLLTEQGKTTSALKAAVSSWKSQYLGSRSLEARIAPARTLHDRAIFVDQSAVWLLSQSIKDFAARSPATVIPIDSQLIPQKSAAYENIWQNSSPL